MPFESGSAVVKPKALSAGASGFATPAVIYFVRFGGAIRPCDSVSLLGKMFGIECIQRARLTPERLAGNTVPTGDVFSRVLSLSVARPPPSLKARPAAALAAKFPFVSHRWDSCSMPLQKVQVFMCLPCALRRVVEPS